MARNPPTHPLFPHVNVNLNLNMNLPPNAGSGARQIST